MKKKWSQGLSCLFFSAAVPWLTACGSNPTILVHPDQVSKERGIAFGRVHVFKGKKDVTGACTIEFENEAEKNTGAFKLDDDGWAFVSLPTGKNYLHFVRCAVWNGLFYGTRKLYFDVPPGRKSSYFGDLTFLLANNDLKTTFGAVGAAPLVGGLTSAVASTVHLVLTDGENTVLVADKLDEATREYERRFQEKPVLATPPAETKQEVE